MCEANAEVHVALKVETFEMPLISRMRVPPGYVPVEPTLDGPALAEWLDYMVSRGPFQP